MSEKYNDRTMLVFDEELTDDDDTPYMDLDAAHETFTKVVDKHKNTAEFWQMTLRNTIEAKIAVSSAEFQSRWHPSDAETGVNGILHVVLTVFRDVPSLDANLYVGACYGATSKSSACILMHLPFIIDVSPDKKQRLDDKTNIVKVLRDDNIVNEYAERLKTECFQKMFALRVFLTVDTTKMLLDNLKRLKNSENYKMLHDYTKKRPGTAESDILSAAEKMFVELFKEQFARQFTAFDRPSVTEFEAHDNPILRKSHKVGFLCTYQFNVYLPHWVDAVFQNLNDQLKAGGDSALSV